LPTSRPAAYFGLRMILILMVKITTILCRRLRCCNIVSSCLICRWGLFPTGISVLTGKGKETVFA
jgi:hypothetical protein